MQEKVEAIAERALSLGERAQKIGEILELINDIADQTNLLALNAAIETARAGEAGSQTRRSAAQRRTLRVPAEKIDHLIGLVGEVMQYRRRLAHSLGEQSAVPQRVANELSTGERVLDELKETAIGMRTIPLASLRARFRAPSAISPSRPARMSISSSRAQAPNSTV